MQAVGAAPCCSQHHSLICSCNQALGSHRLDQASHAKGKQHLAGGSQQRYAAAPELLTVACLPLPLKRLDLQSEQKFSPCQQSR